MSWSYSFTARNKAEARHLINSAPHYVPVGVRGDVLLAISHFADDAPIYFEGNGHLPGAAGEWPHTTCTYKLQPLQFSLPAPKPIERALTATGTDTEKKA